MFRLRKFITKRSCDETLFRLAGMVKDTSFSDFVMENAFSVTVSTIRFRFNGRPLGFQFNGFVKMVDGNTEITYRPTLPKSILLILCILLISYMVAVLNAGVSRDGIILLCGFILIVALLYGFGTLAVRDCIKDFESRLK